MSNFICRYCQHMKMTGRANPNGNNYGLKGPRGECFCEHPKAIESFRRVCPKSPRMAGFIDFTPPGDDYPALKTSPQWCPLKREVAK